MQRDLLRTAILWFLLTFVAELLLPSLDRVIFPLAAAQEAMFSDESFRILLMLGTPVFTFVVAVLGYSLYKFRAKDGELESGSPIHGNNWFSGGWLLITGGLCVTVIIHPGLTGVAKFQSNQTPDLVVQVAGRQWAWDISYPAYNVSGPAELVLPVGKRVKFELTSEDVLHSFWIPAFRDKIDAVPGRVTTMFITPIQTAGDNQDFNLRVQCTEICGLGHAKMSLPVRVVSVAEFESWAKSQKLPDDPAARGQLLYASKGCAGCHSLDGSARVGPTWSNLFGHDVTLSDGKTVKADETYLRESIVAPNAKLAKGFQPNLMPPNLGKTLKKGEIDDLIAYIKSLSK